MSTKINIIINGSKKQVESENLSYEEIITLAHGRFIPYMTVVYYWKDKQSDLQRSGILHAGKGVELAEGMVFSAMNTGNA